METIGTNQRAQPKHLDILDAQRNLQASVEQLQYLVDRIAGNSSDQPAEILGPDSVKHEPALAEVLAGEPDRINSAAQRIDELVNYATDMLF